MNVLTIERTKDWLNEKWTSIHETMIQLMNYLLNEQFIL